MPIDASYRLPGAVDYNTLYLKRVLLSFWVVRLVLMVLYAVIYLAAIIAFSYTDSEVKGRGIGISVALLVVCLITMTIDIVSIFMFIRRKLSPLVLLVFNSIETLIWTVLFVLQVAGVATRRKDGRRSTSPFGWLITFLTFLCFLGLFIYAVVIYLRWRKGVARGEYVTGGVHTNADAFDAGVQQSLDTRMQATRYPGGTGSEFYQPPQRSSQGAQYENYPSEFYAPNASSTSKLPTQEAIELSAQPEQRNTQPPHMYR